MRDKKGFLFRYKWCDILFSLPPEIRHEMFDAIITYILEDRIVELSPSAKVGFVFIIKDLEEDKKRSEQNRKNATARWREGNLFEDTANGCESMRSVATLCETMRSDAKGCDFMQSDAKDLKENEKERNKEKDKENSLEKEKRVKEKETPPGKQFKKPSVEEIAAYIRARGSLYIDAQNFYDFYESKGWMVGKNKMKDWKAAVRTWEKRNKADGKSMGYQIDPEKYDTMELW